MMQVVDRGYGVKEVAARLGISTKSLHTWCYAAMRLSNSSKRKPHKAYDMKIDTAVATALSIFTVTNFRKM
ncbi:hypothetical protein [Asticcacaulis machinosus]|uniref:hypothetical protein n=1 Tax=Asticcacaulis machinosus TaxID=2984211 RepID=UPI003F5DD4F1